MRRALPFLLVLPALGFQCEYFDPVVVPATDTQAPIVATRYWIGGVEHLSFLPVEEIVGPSGAAIAVFPAVYDGGGARRLTVNQTLRVYCHDDDAEPELSQLSTVTFVPRTSTQAGSVGSTVSNGLYLAGDVTDLAVHASLCQPGFDLTKVVYEWSAVGRDFANNVTSQVGNSITYQP